MDDSTWMSISDMTNGFPKFCPKTSQPACLLLSLPQSPPGPAHIISHLYRHSPFSRDYQLRTLAWSSPVCSPTARGHLWAPVSGCIPLWLPPHSEQNPESSLWPAGFAQPAPSPPCPPLLPVTPLLIPLRHTNLFAIPLTHQACSCL